MLLSATSSHWLSRSSCSRSDAELRIAAAFANTSALSTSPGDAAASAHFAALRLFADRLTWPRNANLRHRTFGEGANSGAEQFKVNLNLPATKARFKCIKIVTLLWIVLPNKRSAPDD